MLDMRFVNTDSKSYQLWPPEKCLTVEERDKKRKYLEFFLQKQRNFSLFMESVNILIVIESKSTLEKLDIRLNTKWKQTY